MFRILFKIALATYCVSIAVGEPLKYTYDYETSSHMEFNFLNNVAVANISQADDYTHDQVKYQAVLTLSKFQIDDNLEVHQFKVERFELNFKERVQLDSRVHDEITGARFYLVHNFGGDKGCSIAFERDGLSTETMATMRSLSRLLGFACIDPRNPTKDEKSLSKAGSEENLLNLRIRKSSTGKVMRSTLSNLLELTKSVNIQSDYVLLTANEYSSLSQDHNRALHGSTIRSVDQVETVKLFSDFEDRIHQKILSRQTLRLLSTERLTDDERADLEDSRQLIREKLNRLESILNVHDSNELKTKALQYRVRNKVNEEFDLAQIEKEIELSMKMLRKANNRGKLKYGSFKAVKHLSKLVKNLKKLSQVHEHQELISRDDDLMTTQIFDKITAQVLKINRKVELNVVNKIIADAVLNTNGLDIYLQTLLLKLFSLPKETENSNLINHVLSSIVLQTSVNADRTDSKLYLRKLKSCLNVLIDVLRRLETNDPNNLSKKFEDNYDYHMKLMLAIGSLIDGQNQFREAQKFQNMIGNLTLECDQYFIKLKSLEETNGSYSQLVKYSNTPHECKALVVEAVSNTKYLSDLKRKLLENEFERCLKNSSQTCLKMLRSLSHESKQDPKIFDKGLMDKLQAMFQNSIKDESSNKTIFNSNDIRIESLNILLNNYISFEETPEYILSYHDSKVVLENLLIQLNKEHLENRAKGKLRDEFQVYCKQALLNKMKSSHNFRKAFIESLSIAGVDFYSFFAGDLDSGLSNDFVFEIAKEGRELNFGARIKQVLSDENYLKHLQVDLFNLNNAGQKSELLNLEISTRYLERLTETENSPLNYINLDTDYKSIEPEVNMELSLMSKKLIKFRLFKSYSDMIKRLWALPSTMTSIFQASLPVNDQRDLILLENGLLLEMNTLALASFDISFMNELSIWTQSSKAQARASVALMAEQTYSISHNFIPLVVDEIKLEIPQHRVDLDVRLKSASSAYKFCAKVSQRAYQIRNRHTPFINTANKLQRKKESVRAFSTAPRSFNLSNKATEGC